MASKAETVRQIREIWGDETGEPVSVWSAEVILDRLCDAFFEKYYGAGREIAVREDRMIAEYLKWQWTGEDGRGLRAAIAKVDADEKTRV